jgi:hypothetical protein
MNIKSLYNKINYSTISHKQCDNLDTRIKNKSEFKIYLNSAKSYIIILYISIFDSLCVLGSYKNGNYY